MTILPDGDFKVQTGEIITVTVRASGTIYLAAFSDLSFGNWIMASLPGIPPDPQAEVRRFVMPAVAVNSFDIQFGFPPGTTAPAKYHVTLTGDPAGAPPFAEDVLPPMSPLPPDRDYRFVT